jgi:hypothetical protein
MALTYRIVDHGNAIKCETCGLTSWHPKDVEHLFCGMCHRFHDVPDPVALPTDQYRLLVMVRDRSGPPNNLEDSPHRMILALYQRGLLRSEDGMVYLTDRGIQAMEAYVTEA